jgi:hypothetical protein
MVFAPTTRQRSRRLWVDSPHTAPVMFLLPRRPSTTSVPVRRGSSHPVARGPFSPDPSFLSRASLCGSARSCIMVIPLKYNIPHQGLENMTSIMMSKQCHVRFEKNGFCDYPLFRLSFPACNRFYFLSCLFMSLFNPFSSSFLCPGFYLIQRLSSEKSDIRVNIL